MAPVHLNRNPPTAFAITYSKLWFSRDYSRNLACVLLPPRSCIGDCYLDSSSCQHIISNVATNCVWMHCIGEACTIKPINTLVALDTQSSSFVEGTTVQVLASVLEAPVRHNSDYTYLDRHMCTSDNGRSFMHCWEGPFPLYWLYSEHHTQGRFPSWQACPSSASSCLI